MFFDDWLDQFKVFLSIINTCTRYGKIDLRLKLHVTVHQDSSNLDGTGISEGEERKDSSRPLYSSSDLNFRF